MDDLSRNLIVGDRLLSANMMVRPLMIRIRHNAFSGTLVILFGVSLVGCSDDDSRQVVPGAIHQATPADYQAYDQEMEQLSAGQAE